MARLFTFEQLPHLHSTRDTRDRLDLVTDNVPVNAQAIRADRIIYHPGDTAAKHYHTDCHHLFFVLYGNGTCTWTGEVIASPQARWLSSPLMKFTGLRMTRMKILPSSSSGDHRRKRRFG